MEVGAPHAAARVVRRQTSRLPFWTARTSVVSANRKHKKDKQWRTILLQMMAAPFFVGRSGPNKYSHRFRRLTNCRRGSRNTGIASDGS